MDFITGLPERNGKNALMVCCDKLGKLSRLVPIFRHTCTRAYMLRGVFADVAQGKWHPRFTKFMLLAHNSTRLCLLEFGLSI